MEGLPMARDFNGSTDRLDWSSRGDLTGHALTKSAWIYLDTLPGSGLSEYIMTIHRSGDTSFGTVFGPYGNAGAIDFFRNGTSLLDHLSNSSQISTGAWTHVLVTHDGVISTASTVHTYVNGVEVSYSSSANGASEYAPTGSWSLGGRIYDDNRNIDGRLAEVAVWDRILSAAEIGALAGGLAPNLVNNGSGLLFYYSAKTDTTTAETGGAAATVDGTSYSASHPTISYSVSVPRVMQQRKMQGMS
jgi:hypothetical protein